MDADSGSLNASPRAAVGGMRSDGPTPGVFPPPESARPTIYGEQYVISAGHPLVAMAGARVFEAGGNAVDAGVAAGLAAAVVQADMCNLGGVAPILVRPAASDAVFSVAGLGWWGQAVTVTAFTARYGGDMPLGPPVAVVPAAVSAYVRALQRFGTWRFAECAAAASALAGDGFCLDAGLAQSLAIMGRGWGRWPQSRAVYWPEGRPPRRGDRLVQPALAATLEALHEAERSASSGDGEAGRRAGLDAVHDAFYRGEIARIIARFAQDHGGWLTEADLAAFDAEIETAVSAPFRDWQVWTPAAWCQGPALLQALAVLGAERLEDLGHNSAGYVHLLAEAIKQAFLDRERYYGDPRFVDVPLGFLLSGEHAAQLRAAIDPAAAHPGAAAALRTAPGRFDTTYICAVGADGTAFSAMPSDTLDGSPIIPELGLMISPRGVQSRLDPDHPACLAPGKRPRMTPAPAIALRGRQPGASDREVMAFGSPGGDVILQAMLQGFLNVTVFGMPPQQAVEAPRFAVFAWPGSFYPHAAVPARASLEGRFSEAVHADLASRGHDVVRWPDYEFDAGGLAIAMDAAPPAGRRVLAAGADPRRLGYALGR
ncbi:MAG TPA: gamma-glutamyltransferase [Streptosporangiaceae bacterium]|jgi:gamma-glutamyltranspeptidase/glutathione hydrolase|nr:gamma-glutamyltransferase [Streptosporangiaceae bacterium]